MYHKQDTRPVPPDAPRRIHGGISQAKIRVDGKDVWCDLTPTGRAKVTRAEWYGQLRKADGTIKPVRLCRDKAAAEALFSKLQRQEERIRAGLEIPIRETKEDFPAILARFWKDRARRQCTPVYLSEAKAKLGRAMAELGLDSMEKIKALTKVKLEAWMDDMKSRTGGLAASGTKFQKAIQLKVLLSWLMKENLISRIPEFPRNKVVAKFPRRDITRQEVDKLVAASPWPRNLLYGLGFSTLARRGALFNIRAEDLDLDPVSPSLMLRARHSKTKTEQKIPIPRKLVPDLARLISETKPGRPIFQTIDQGRLSEFFEADLKAAGVPKETENGRLVIHSLRHGGATELLQKGVSVVLVQRMGGWSSPMVLLRHYAHLSPVRDRKDIDAVFE